MHSKIKTVGIGSTTDSTMPTTEKTLAWAEKKPGYEATNPQEDLNTFKQFIQGTTLHGIRYVFDDDKYRMRRWFWMATMLLAIGAFVIGVGVRSGEFFAYRTTTSVAVLYADKVVFPAVTVCNQNNFRLSQAVEDGWFEMLSEVFSDNTHSDELNTFSADGNMTKEFLLAASHQLQDFVIDCTWDHRPCNLSAVRQIATDFGVCYTFNSINQNPVMESVSSGASSGLKLLLNVEQYEYMSGPHTDAGVKILLHDQGEFPLVDDLGFSVAPGTHTLVGIEQSQIKALASPYGDCSESNSHLSNCLIVCKGRIMMKSCGCTDLFIERNTTKEYFPMCDAVDLFGCIYNATDLFHSKLAGCQCSVPCERVSYKASLSYTLLSEINANRMSKKQNIITLKSKYQNAKEIASRKLLEVVQTDMDKTNKIKQAYESAKNALSLIEHGLGTGNDSLHAYTANVEKAIGADMEYFVTRMYTIFGKPLYEIQSTTFEAKDYAAHRIYFLLTESTEDYSGYTAMHPYGAAISKLEGWIEACLADDPALTLGNPPTNGSEESCIAVAMGSNDFPEDYVCRNLTDMKRDCAATLSSTLTMTLASIRQAYDIGLPTFYEVFANSLSNITTFDQFQESCLDAFNYHKPSYLYTNLNAYASVVESFQYSSSMPELAETIENITQHLTNDIFVSEHDSHEMWEEECLHKYTHGFAESMYERVDESLSRTSERMQDAITMTMEKLGRASDSLTDAEEYITLITAYENKQITKLELAEKYLSYESFQLMEYLIQYKNDLSDYLSIVSSNLKLIRDQMIDMYIDIMTTEYPCISASEVANLTIIEAMYTMGAELPSSTINSGDTLAAYMDHICTSTFQKLDQTRDYYSVRISLLKAAIDDFNIDLGLYEEENKVDSVFVMSNMMQVDIFYKEIGYDHISQHPAFEMLSLLGEVGGFLGLLLGASILTVFELIDFLIMKVSRRCGRKVTPRR